MIDLSLIDWDHWKMGILYSLIISAGYLIYVSGDIGTYTEWGYWFLYYYAVYSAVTVVLTTGRLLHYRYTEYESDIR